MKGLKVLSLFDGISCGMMALRKADYNIEKYVAYEIDEYAKKISNHNFKEIKQMGDVFEADFTQYKDFDLLIGGSPCTHWSIAQKDNRETEASGIGWELFQQYARAVNEVKPKAFLYENNKSMSKKIKKSITNEFGFEPVCINSALLSAQNRERFYWVGIRNNDGTYRSANIVQPNEIAVDFNSIFDTNEYQVGIPIRIPDYGKHNKFRPAEALYPNHTGTAFGSLRQRLFSEKSYKQQEDIVAERITKDKYDEILNDKSFNVYEIRNGNFIYQNEEFPISMGNGYYIFRRLSVNEYKKIQTIPDYVDFSIVSNGRAYKGIGNGWNVDTVVYILEFCKQELEK